MLPDWEQVRGWFSLVGLLLLAGLSYALLRWVEDSLRPPPAPDSQAPLLVVEQFRALRLNPAGLPETVVTAPRLTQWPGQTGATVEQPVLDWYLPDGTTREWRLHAERGWLAADRQTIRLEGETVMTRTAASGKPPLEIVTRDLTLRPTERTAETAEPIRAITPDGTLHAIGARAWLDQQQLELLSAVRGSYAPPPSSF